MDWFKGKITGKIHDLNGKIDGFRLRFPLKPIQLLVGGFKHFLYSIPYMGFHPSH